MQVNPSDVAKGGPELSYLTYYLQNDAMNDLVKCAACPRYAASYEWNLDLAQPFDPRVNIFATQCYPWFEPFLPCRAAHGRCSRGRLCTATPPPMACCSPCTSTWSPLPPAPSTPTTACARTPRPTTTRRPRCARATTARPAPRDTIRQGRRASGTASRRWAISSRFSRSPSSPTYGEIAIS